MYRHYNRRRWNYSPQDWARYHENKRQEVAILFGGIERDILNVFLHLPSFAREGLLSRYGDKFGRSAEQHARKTYPDWQSGAVRPAAKTLERLLEFLPPYLTDAQRFDLVRKLRAHHLIRKELHLTTTPGCWRDDLMPIVQQLLDHGAAFELPQLVHEKATWLANGDVTAARKLLQAIDEEEARLRLSYVEAEFKRIEFLVEHVINSEPVKHRIELPQGNIFVTIQRKQKSTVHRIVELLSGRITMDDEKDKLLPQVRPSGELAKRPTPGSLLNTSLEKLPEEQQRKLANKVAEAKVELGIAAENADQRHYDSTRDMANTIRAADALERTTKSDFELKGTFDTASGRTDIRITKNNNTVIIVVAIVVGVIILLLLKH